MAKDIFPIWVAKNERRAGGVGSRGAERPVPVFHRSAEGIGRGYMFVCSAILVVSDGVIFEIRVRECGCWYERSLVQR